MALQLPRYSRLAVKNSHKVYGMSQATTIAPNNKTSHQAIISAGVYFIRRRNPEDSICASEVLNSAFVADEKNGKSNGKSKFRNWDIGKIWNTTSTNITFMVIDSMPVLIAEVKYKLNSCLREMKQQARTYPYSAILYLKITFYHEDQPTSRPC